VVERSEQEASSAPVTTEKLTSIGGQDRRNSNRRIMSVQRLRVFAAGERGARSRARRQ
jgi:hypothetical protein